MYYILTFPFTKLHINFVHIKFICINFVHIIFVCINFVRTSINFVRVSIVYINFVCINFVSANNLEKDVHVKDDGSNLAMRKKNLKRKKNKIEKGIIPGKRI